MEHHNDPQTELPRTQEHHRHSDTKQSDVPREMLLRQQPYVVGGQIATGLAGEIRNPVGYVKSNLQTLEEYARVLLQVSVLAERLADAVSVDQRQFAQYLAADLHSLLESGDIEQIRNEGVHLIRETHLGVDRITEVATAMRELAFDSAERVSEFALADVVRETLVLIKHELRHLFRLEVTLDDTETIRIARGKLVLALVNVLYDIKSALPEGGKIVIRSCDGDGETTLIILYDGPGLTPPRHETAQRLVESIGGYVIRQRAGKTGHTISIAFPTMEHR